MIIGVENTNTEWTNVAPSIAVRSTDYLTGTVTAGSGLRSVKIYNDNENLVAAGSNQASYTLRETDEGERTFVIEATDNVGHISRSSVTTRYDITPPGIDGTEITFVRDGIVVSGYMQDNIMDQHIDDEIVRSVHGANKSSGIKSVIVYKLTSLFVMNYPKTVKWNAFTDLQKLGCPIFLTFQMSNMKEEDRESYLRMLERRYCRNFPPADIENGISISYFRKGRFHPDLDLVITTKKCGGRGTGCD